jgi:hypothetical protein
MKDEQSLMPERDEIWAKHDGLTPALAAEMLVFAGKMEIDRNEWKEEAELRSKETEVFKNNVKLLADELKSENEKAIEWFIHANELKESLRVALQWIDDGTDQEGRDLIVAPLRAKHFQPKQ